MPPAAVAKAEAKAKAKAKAKTKAKAKAKAPGEARPNLSGDEDPGPSGSDADLEMENAAGPDADADRRRRVYRAGMFRASAEAVYTVAGVVWHCARDARASAARNGAAVRADMPNHPPGGQDFGRTRAAVHSLTEVCDALQLLCFGAETS